LDSSSHTQAQGGARMVDVSDKPVQRRIARAAGRITLAASTVELIRNSRMEKGDVLTVARIAGIQAAKQTCHIVPLCHPLVLDSISVDVKLEQDGVSATSEVRCCGRTGVEMEALIAVSAALLTVYDMCKAVDEGMVIGDIRLIEKMKQDV